MADFTLNISEAIVTADTIGKGVGISRSEALQVKDERRDNARAVVSDIEMSAGDITPEQFAKMLTDGAPVGYEVFRNYINGGDYDYKDAVYKVLMVTNSSSYPRIIKLTTHIDVPDVFDRGVANSSATAVVRILFNRPFYAIPKVTATLKGGTAIATPIITNEGIDGFDLEMLTAESVRVAGQVSWTAKGY